MNDILHFFASHPPAWLYLGVVLGFAWGLVIGSNRCKAARKRAYRMGFSACDAYYRMAAKIAKAAK